MIDRRSLIVGLFTAGQAPSAEGIIDTHTHFYDPSRPEGVPWPPKTETVLYRTVLPRHFKQVTSGLEVTSTVVIEASPWVEDNQWLLDLAKQEPVIAGVVGNLDPAASGFRDALERFAKNRQFRGLRLGGRAIANGVGRSDFISALERVSGAGLGLDALGDASMLPAIVRLSDRIPGLRIVIDNMPYDMTPDTVPALRELAGRTAVYAKVSGVLRRVNGQVSGELDSYRGSIDELWNVFGPQRLVYGSNWPVSGRMAPYSTVLKVVREYFEEKGAAASNRFFSANARAAYAL